eukprot:4061557-Prymnesium_polylepis.1
MMDAQGNEAPYGDGEAPWIVVENGDISSTRRRPARSRAFTEIYEPWVSTEYPVSTLPPTTHGNGHNPSDPIEFIDPPPATEIRTRSIRCVCPKEHGTTGCHFDAEPNLGGLCQFCCYQLGGNPLVTGRVLCRCACGVCQTTSGRSEDTELGPDLACMDCDYDGVWDDRLDPPSPAYSPDVDPSNWWRAAHVSPAQNFRPECMVQGDGHDGDGYPATDQYPSYREVRLGRGP